MSAAVPRALASARGRVVEELGFHVGLVVYARWVLGLRRAGTFEWGVCTPDMLLAGTAPTPFQYRALVVVLARALRPYAPSARAAFEVVEIASAVALAWAFRAHLTALLGGGPAARRAAIAATPLVAVVVPLQYVLVGEVLGLRRYVYFPWDLPGAFAFLACVSLLRGRRWAVYYPAFVLATLTRETTVFLPILQLLVGPREGERPGATAAHAASQLALWAAIKLALRWAYRANPGVGAYQDVLGDNLSLLADAGAAARVMGCFAFLWVPALLGASRIDDGFTRRSLRVLPLWFVGMLAVANLYELRVFGELGAAVVLPAWILLLRSLFREVDAAR